MKRISIEDLNSIRDELDNLNFEDVLMVEDNETDRYVIMSYELYAMIENILSGKPQIKIATNEDLELSYEEYEKIKKEVVEAFDSIFKPNPEKLN